MSNKNYSQDVTSIAENAFVPGENEEIADSITRENRPLSAEEKMYALFAEMDNIEISTPAFDTPKNGEHMVVIMDYELKNGYKGSDDYFVIQLKELSRNITWGMTLPATGKDVSNFLGEINMYNKGMLYKLNPLKAFGVLQKEKFRVWTQEYKDDKNVQRVKTYSNPEKYEKFARYLAFKATEAKAQRNNEKAPWEE